MSRHRVLDDPSPPPTDPSACGASARAPIVSHAISTSVSRCISPDVSTSVSPGVSPGISPRISPGVSPRASRGIPRGISRGRSRDVFRGIVRNITLAIAVVITAWLVRLVPRDKPSGTVHAVNASVAPIETQRESATTATSPSRSAPEQQSSPTLDHGDVLSRQPRDVVAAPAVAVVPPTPEQTDDDATIRTAVREAMPSVMPLIQACYERALPDLDRKDFTTEVELELTGDPDIGTMIDAEVLAVPGQAYPGAFVNCIRSEVQQLELPPLAPGRKVTVTHPFVFGAQKSRLAN